MKKLLSTAALFWLISLFLPVNLCPDTGAAGKHNVVIIMSASLDPYKQTRDGIVASLHAKNIEAEIHEYTMDNRGDEILKELRVNKPDIIFALGTRAAKLATDEYKDFPIIICMVMDPTVLHQPNVTGIRMNVSAVEKLKLVRKILPHAKKIGMFYSKDRAVFHEELSSACEEMGLSLYSKQIESEADIPDAISELSRQIDFFVMTPDSSIYFPKSIEHLLLEGLRNKFPIMGLSSYYTKAGTICSLECDYRLMGAQAAGMAKEIFDGKSPGNIPFADPEGKSLSLNMLIAKRLGIAVSRDIRNEARDVFGEGE